MSPILGIWASAQQGSLSTAYDSIQTVTVGAGGASTVSFTNIPSTYTHLQVRYFNADTRSASNTGQWMTFNGSSAANYFAHDITGSAQYGISVNAYTNQTYIGIPNTSGGTNTNNFGVGIIDILDYANTNKYKTIRAIGGHEENATDGYVQFSSGAWASTSAITSMTFYPLLAPYRQYSIFALYGIKG